MVEEPIVLFYREDEENGWLSNFYAAPIKWMGTEWATSEHLYQAFKTPSASRAIQQSATPKEAKQVSHLAAEYVPEASQPTLERKAQAMRIAIRHKFDQHAELRRKLVMSQGRLIEASPTDALWGYGPDGKGLNLMGLLLMELRASYRAAGWPQ